MTTFLWHFVKKKEVNMLKTPINREIRSFALREHIPLKQGLRLSIMLVV